MVYWLMSILTHLYFHSFDAIKNQRIGKRWPLSAIRLSPAERLWSTKIYGIYNDFVFYPAKAREITSGRKRKNLETFTDYFDEHVGC